MGNGVAAVEPNSSFSILAVNFARYDQWLVKGQTLGTVLPHPTSVIGTKLTMAEVVCLIDQERRQEQPSDEDDRFISALLTHQGKGDPAVAHKPSSLSDMKLSQVDEKHRHRLVKMIQKYAKMCDGS